LRIYAANAAIGHEGPRLSAIDLTIDGRLGLSELMSCR
jgi:hypothetical protein